MVPTLLFFGFGAKYITYNGAFGTVIGTSKGFCYQNGTHGPSFHNHTAGMDMGMGKGGSGMAYPTTYGDTSQVFGPMESWHYSDWSVPPMGPAAYDTRYSQHTSGSDMGVLGIHGCPANVQWSLLLPFALWINSGFVSISASQSQFINQNVATSRFEM